jgi:ADP-ribose pyrophosphatase YjhB (NUDIX family)
MVRETYEETGVQMDPSQFLLIGESEDQGFPVRWVSYVYVATAPEQMTVSRKYVVEYPFQFPLSHYKENLELSQWQVWMARHMDFLCESFDTMAEIRSLLYYLQKGEKPQILYCPDKIFRKYERDYDKVFRLKLKENTLSQMYEKGYILLSAYKEIHVTWPELGDVSEKEDCKKLLQKAKRLIDIHVFFRLQGIEVTRTEVQSILLAAMARDKIKVNMGFYSVK